MDFNKFIYLFVLSLGVMIKCESPCDLTPNKYPGAWLDTNSLTWLKYHEEPADWDTARLMCAAEGALLASPTDDVSRALNRIAWRFASNAVFTGIRVFYFTGSYVSVIGSSLAKISDKWVTAEEELDEDNSRAKCVILNRDGTIELAECNKQYPYICYKKYEKVQTGCEKGYTLCPSSNSCHKLHNKLLIHDQAEEVCVQEGGHLLVINSEAERESIKTLIKQSPTSTYQMRIGFKKVNNTWITVDDETLDEAGFSRFVDEKPNSSTEDRDCGSIQRDTVLLTGISCNTTASNFICEKNRHCV